MKIILLSVFLACAVFLPECIEGYVNLFVS
jgi:hypothetical protein